MNGGQQRPRPSAGEGNPVNGEATLGTRPSGGNPANGGSHQPRAPGGGGNPAANGRPENSPQPQVKHLHV